MSKFEKNLDFVFPSAAAAARHCRRRGAAAAPVATAAAAVFNTFIKKPGMVVKVLGFEKC